MDMGIRGSGSNANCDEELKTQFMTREGIYRLMTLSEYSRPNRVGYANSAQGGTTAGCPGGPVKVSFVSLPKPVQPVQQQPTAAAAVGQGTLEATEASTAVTVTGSSAPAQENNPTSLVTLDRITFNYGREIFVYPYRGVRKAADLTKPIDKRIYKGTFPTCHDFGPVTEESEIVPLVVGFSGGQIQLVDPIRKELSKLFNEERNIDKTRVTCIKWIPGSQTSFIAAHSSGCMYVYNYDVLCPNTVPAYQLFKQGKGFTVYTCKTKTTRNPVYKWTIGSGKTVWAVNEFAFSPCGHFLAVASQDGFLRIFNYDTMEPVGRARSYFGGFLCVCWSPDGKYVVCGGEDDLVTVYSIEEKRVMVRGQGHKSWVSVVAFDPYNMSYGELPDGLDFSGSDEEGPPPAPNTNQAPPSASAASPNSQEILVNNHHNKKAELNSSSSFDSNNVTCYRFGSVGQDTLLCLWDLTEDILKQSRTMMVSTVTSASAKTSPSSMVSITSSSFNNAASRATGNHIPIGNSPVSLSKDSGLVDASSNCSSNSASANNTSTSMSNSLTQRLVNLNFGDRKDKRNSSGRSGSASTSGLGASSSKNSSQTSLLISGGANGFANGEEVAELGCPQCPRINETPLIEPLVCKKIAHERLTALVFREDCLVTACQDGYVCTWARPGKVNTNVMYPSSPQTSSSGRGDGNSTIV